MTLDEAMALASQDCPLPHRAGEALRLLRDHVRKQETLLDGYREVVLGYAVIVGDLTKGLDPHDPIYTEIMRVGTAWVRLDPEYIRSGRTPVRVGIDSADGVDTTLYAQLTAGGQVLFLHEEQNPMPAAKPSQPGSSYGNAPPILPIAKRIGTNDGHGHVWDRPDGARARCGGPALCSSCRRDQQDVENLTVTRVLEEITERALTMPMPESSGPAIVCTGCGTPIFTIATPLCPACWAKLSSNQGEQR